MSGTVPVNFRVLPTEREAWKQQAEKEGVSLTELVRRTMNARLGADKVTTAVALQRLLAAAVALQRLGAAPSIAKNFQSETGAPPVPVPGPSFQRPRRTETCEHRLAPETFCRWCDG